MQIDQMQHGAWIIYTVCQFYPPPAHLRYLTVSGARYVWHIHGDQSRRTKTLIPSSQRRAVGLGTSLGEDPPTDSPHFWCGCHATPTWIRINTRCGRGAKLCVIYAHIITIISSLSAHMEHMQHIRYDAQIQLYRNSWNHHIAHIHFESHSFIILIHNSYFESYNHIITWFPNHIW
jgi:hypothetical protein